MNREDDRNTAAGSRRNGTWGTAQAAARNSGDRSAGSESAKRMLRREFLAVRKRFTADDVEGKSVAISAHAEALEALAGGGDLNAAEAADRAPAPHGAGRSGPGTVAAYVSVGSEPGTLPLIGRLHARGIRVLLPVLLPDNDLSWGLYTGDEHLVTVHHEGRMALREPAAPHLSPDAVLQADVVLLPGLAVDGTGMRLGRGGGSYDRVVSRLEQAGRDPYLVVLLYDEEVTATLPHEPHDRPVHAAVTPSGVHRFL